VTIILGWILAGLVMVMLPFFLFGWLLKGWRPFVTTLVLWTIAVFVFSLWQFAWWAVPFQYFIALAGYLAGAKIRTGKELEELLPTPTATDGGH
jgi:hypothetical protein